MKRKMSVMFLLCVCGAFSALSTDYFVSIENGNDVNSGSKDKPFKTISKAAALVAPGDRIIVRAGIYRETVRLNKKATKEKSITLMNFKDEKVFVKGSEAFKISDFALTDMPGFDKNSSWMKSHGGSVPNVFIKKNFPINPSQVFVDGRALTQIGDDAKSVALDGNWTRLSTGSSPLELRINSFFYDQKTKSLYLRLYNGYEKSHPEALVEISMRQNILTTGSKGEYIIIKGIHFSHTSTLGNPYGGVAVQLRNNCVMENCSVTWCAGMGVAANGKNPQVINCELAFNGNDGFNANQTKNFLVSRCEIHHNNYRDYNPNWHTGGLKIIPDAYGTIENCKIHDNYAYGIWFDSDNSGKRSIIRGNTIAQNVGGIYLEVSSDFLVENNYIVYNTYFAMQAIGSNIVIKNNTFANNSGYCTIGVLPRGIRKYKPLIWHCENNVIENNLFMDNRTRIEIHLPADDPKNGVGNMKCDYNSFIRIGGSKFRFTKGAVGKKDYKDFMDNAHISKWRTKTGFDKHSYYWDGNIPHRFGKPRR
jgi:parallel beta-helix repeat protein